MKIILGFLNIILLSLLFSCENTDAYKYEKGYEAAWNVANEPSWYSSKEYKNGYEQGQQDAEYYDMGFGDGYDKEKCIYPKDPDYMDGYKDGVKRRKARL